MQVTRDEKKVPGEAWNVVQEVKRHDMGWEYVYDAHLVDMSRRLQVRGLKNAIMPRNVRKARTGYERGDLLPPPLVTNDWYIVDGANRMEGARAAKRNTLGMVRIHINYEAATEAQKRALVALGTALNNMHGVGMTKADNAERVRELAVDGRGAKEIAEELHMDTSEVNGVLAEQRAVARLERLGVSTEGLKAGHLREFGYKGKQITDTVLKPAASLVRDTHINVHDTRDLMKSLGMKATEVEKLEMLERLDKERAHFKGAGTSRKTGASARMGQAVGRVLQLDGQTENAVETNPDFMDERAAKLRAAISVLEKTLHNQMEAQRAVMVSR